MDYTLDADLAPDFDPDALDTSEPRPEFTEVHPEDVEVRDAQS